MESIYGYIYIDMYIVYVQSTPMFCDSILVALAAGVTPTGACILHVLYRVNIRQICIVCMLHSAHSFAPDDGIYIHTIYIHTHTHIYIYIYI